MPETAQVTLEEMEAANEIVAGVHTLMQDETEPGVTTEYLDQLAEEYIRDHDASPIFKGYRGFPKTLCTSLNEEIVHGIPSEDRVVEDGDILSIDVGARKFGACGDSAQSIGVGSISAKVEKLLDVTRKALYQGIQQAKPGNQMGEVGQAIEDYVKPYGFGIVRDWAGHFIGHEMHLDPKIPNYGPADRGPELEVGMFMAIEPMVNLGTHKGEVLEDGWTVVTKDGSLSAHFEHTVAVTENGPKILSRREDEVLL
ncbi:MAG: type I methionyl aminopeptidase [bacterium]